MVPKKIIANIKFTIVTALKYIGSTESKTHIFKRNNAPANTHWKIKNCSKNTDADSKT